MSSIALIGIIVFFIVGCSHAAPINDTSKPDLTKLEQSSQLFEGDMKFPTKGRGVLRRGSTVRWPGGIVPYVISSSYGVVEQSTIIAAMRRLESLVAVNNRQCVLFRPRLSTDQYYISIENRQGCSSYVGQNTGVNMVRTVSLQHPGCIYEGTIMHEFLHTLGFFHEQSRPDRDSYVRVNYANIQTGLESNFNKYGNDAVDTQSTPYDYGSLMHYGPTAFSKNGLPTIEPLRSGVVIGQRNTLSAIDIQEVRLFYGCSGTGPPLPPTITSRYSHQLTTSSPKFNRPGGSSSNYYYQAIRLIVTRTDSYTFDSNSALDAYGIVYNAGFSALRPTSNILAQNDDGAGNRQFRLTLSLTAGIGYVLVFTTYSTNIIGAFSITGTGPSQVSFTRLTN